MHCNNDENNRDRKRFVRSDFFEPMEVIWVIKWYEWRLLRKEFVNVRIEKKL